MKDRPGNELELELAREAEELEREELAERTEELGHELAGLIESIGPGLTPEEIDALIEEQEATHYEGRATPNRVGEHDELTVEEHPTL